MPAIAPTALKALPAHPPVQPRLAGCHFCEAVNRVADPSAEHTCWRCASPLEPADIGLAPRQRVRSRLSAVMALVCTGWVCVLTANLLPMVSLDLNGQHSQVNLTTAAYALWGQQRLALSATLFITTVIAPALEMAAMGFIVPVLLSHARVEQRRAAPGWLVPALHLWQGMRAWNLTEVLVLGTAVALVKLGQIATLAVGPGLVALMALMALRLATQRWLTPADAWSLLEVRGRRTAPRHP